MFEKIVERLLNKILGQYVEDFKSDNLNIGLWSGDVVLKDVKLNKQTMKKLNLPFKIKFSNLRCLKMNIPWSSLASSKIQVLIQGLQLLIAQVHPSLWELKNQKIIQLRKEQIKAYCQSIVQDFAQKALLQQKSSKPQQQKGYISNMVLRIIDNLQITVKDIHIRYQDQITKQYSFGITLQQLKIFTINENDQPTYLDRTKKQFKNQPLRKKLILNNFGLYWNQKSNFFQTNYSQKLKQTIAKKQSTNNQMNYMMLMSFQAHLLKRDQGQQFVLPQIDFFLDFDQLKFQISNSQLQQIVNMGQRLQTYSTQVKRKNKVKQTKQQLQKNIQTFMQIFPIFYKSDTSLTLDQMKKLQDILQKMQVDTFKPLMKKHLQQKQKQRIIKDRESKSRGWFSGPKAITQQQKKQIQKFLDENFGKQIAQITRPKQYFHTRINFRVKLLQLIIANTQNNKTEGIRSQLVGIGMQFKMRQLGYFLEFGINDVKINLFKKLKGFPEQQKQFLKKSVQTNQDQSVGQYVRLIVQGSPIDRPYADTSIQLLTQELLIMFDPKIINIATNFANIKINAENSSAALQKYGQLKEKTTASVSETIQSKKKSFIYIDIKMKAITAILYFDPLKPTQIWAVTLGQTKIYTDKQTLQITQTKANQPAQKYSLQLNEISLKYFKNQQKFFAQKSKPNNLNQERLDNVFTKLNIDLTLQIFKQSTRQVPKIIVSAQMNKFNANLTVFLYQNLQKIGNCFQDQQSDQLKIQQRSQQKSQIIKNAKKIGFIYIQDTTLAGKTWKKLVSILTDNYLYIYLDKKDINYTTYYYVKAAQIKIQSFDPVEKLFIFSLKNKVNAGLFGFQKESVRDDWIQAIKKYSINQNDQINQILNLKKNASQLQNNKQQTQSKLKQVDPNLMSVVFKLNIQQIAITTYLKQEKLKNQIVQISLGRLRLTLSNYAKKMIVQLSLRSIDLKDNILEYKMPNLSQFLYTDINSKQQKLIDIKVVDINQTHPNYKFIDKQIFVSFGRLICNYKAETVIAVMKFFMPPKQASTQKKQLKKQQQTNQPANSKIGLISTIFHQKMQRFSMQVHLKMSQISVKLINTKTKVFFAEISMQNFEMMFGISDMRTVLTGGLQQLSLKDYSNYPNTIIQQQQKYDHFMYIMTSQRRKKGLKDNENQIPHLIFFDVNMLNKPNENGKKMIILAQINDLQVSYIQQPVLRLITYLNTQLLPSLQPNAGNELSKQNQKDFLKSKLAKQQQLRKKDEASLKQPQQNPMDLSLTITNINVMLQPRSVSQQQLKLNIRQITVKNKSIYRGFIYKSDDKVLVENYDINLTDMSMFVNYSHPLTQLQRSYKLTPDIDFKLSLDLIQNPLYYQKTYQNDFLDGMRIDVWMSDFFMRINHQDYNFLMKCLYWNVTFDDNAEPYLFDAPEQSEQEKKRQIPPLYLNLKIESISLFIIEDQLPLAFMLLNSLDYQFTKKGNNATCMRLNIQNLIGSNIVHKPNGISIERGMFNSFAYQRTFKTDELRDLDKLLQKFQRKNLLESKINRKPLITFDMLVQEDQSTYMGIKIQQLKIVVQMRTLLLLSKLALIQDYIQPEPSKIQKLQTQEQKQLKKKQQLLKLKEKEKEKEKAGKKQIYVSVNNFLASLTDSQNQNFFIMQGQVIVKMTTLPIQSNQRIKYLSRKSKQQKFLQHTNNVFQLRQFSIYFCNIRNMSNKRYILKPFSVFASQKMYYQTIKSKDGQFIILQTDIDGEVQKLIFQASIRDLLKINQIAQENLANMKKDQKEKGQRKAQKKQDKTPALTPQTQNIMQRTLSQINTKSILQKTRAKIKLSPLSILVVNDCNKNFMPVLRFVLQQTIPTFESNLLQSRLNITLLFGLSFFNARSSKWQPVIQNYGIVTDYFNVIGQKVPHTCINITNLQPQQLKQLRINISTQFIASLMSTLQTSKQQQQKIIKSSSKQIEQQLIEVSPFIFQNITHKLISIKRTVVGISSNQDFILKPMFKGTVRLTQDSPDLVFQIDNQTYKFSLEHYGIIKINKINYYIQFKVEKLNRVIRFLSEHVLQNQLHKKLYVKRYFLNGIVDQLNVELQVKDMLPLDGVKQIQVSLNGISFSEKVEISLVRNAVQDKFPVRALKQNFLLWLTKKSLPNKFTVFEIWPPLLIYNCLPKQFTIQFLLNKQIIRQGVSAKQIKAQQSHELTANINLHLLKYQIKVPGFYWSPQFCVSDDIIGQERCLELTDRLKGTTTINYMVDKGHKGYKLIIYCKAFLVSQIQDDILAYGNLAKQEKQSKLENYYVLGGQRDKSPLHDDDIIIIGSQYGTQLRICGDGCVMDFSQPFSLGGIGITQNRRIVIKRQYKGKKMDLFTTIGIDVSIKKMFKHLQIFSKMIIIHSRAILVNKTSKQFKVRQQGGHQDIFRVEPNERRNLYFSMPQNSKRPRGLIFSCQNSYPSNPVNISELGTMYFKIMNIEKQQEQYYKVLIQQVSKYIFYEISELNSDTIPYQIQNQMPNAKVLLKFNNITLHHGEKFSFINQQMTTQHLVKIRITYKHSPQPKDIIIKPDDLNFKQRESFEVEVGGMKATVHVEIKIKFNDNRKFIIIDQVAHRLGYDVQKQLQEYQIKKVNLKLQKIVFSLIQNHISIARPFQSFCFFLQGIQFINWETNLQQKYQFKIRYLQFDQDQPFSMPNPVIITPYKMKQFALVYDQEKKVYKSKKSIFNIYVNVDKTFTQNTFINMIQMEFNDLVIKISQYFIDVVMQMTKQFVQVSNYKQEDYLVKRQVDKWNEIQIPKEGAKTFIKYISIAPFVLQVSAQIKLDKLDTQSSMFFGTILNAFGVVATNIEGAPIKLDGIDLSDCVDTLAGINQKLMKHYKSAVIKQFYKVFGSLNIIGNPVGFFRNVSTGFRDLKDKPSQGFVKGPLEFGMGIAEGTSSLFANVIGGGLNSISKVTGTISSGIAVLTFDKQFEELRQKQRIQKPQHVFEGLQKGGKAVFYGFRQGIKGVFLQPYQGTKKQGMVGLVKGTAKGFAGLIMKPVSGIIDFASKTTQGMKNTALYLQDKPNQNRMRYPRVLYTQCRTVRNYDILDSKLNAIVQKAKYEDDQDYSFFIQSYKCDDDTKFLLILQDKIMIVSLKDEQIKWTINMKHVKIKDDKKSKELLIQKEGDDKSSKFSFFTSDKQSHTVRIKDDKERQKIISQIDIIQKEYI